jgi:hypothetical protein
MGAETYHQLADAILDLDRVEDIVIILRMFYVAAYTDGAGHAPVGALINQAKLDTPLKAALRLQGIDSNERERLMAEAEQHICIIDTQASETACGVLAPASHVINLVQAAEQVVGGNNVCKVCLKEVAMLFAKPAGYRIRKG